MNFSNGQSLFSGVTTNLSSTYSTLMSSISQSGKGISLDDLSKTLDAKTLTALGGNTTFLSYLKSNFKTLDIDGDGEITAKDMNTSLDNIQNQGLTYDQIQQLCANSGNSSLYNTVLEYFQEIDTNGDGKVTSKEISDFNTKCERYKMEQKYLGYKASSASLFYSDGVTDDTSSVLDSMMPDFKSSDKNN